MRSPHLGERGSNLVSNVGGGTLSWVSWIQRVGRDRSLPAVQFNPPGGAALRGIPSSWSFLENLVLRELYRHQIAIKTIMMMMYIAKKKSALNHFSFP